MKLHKKGNMVDVMILPVLFVLVVVFAIAAFIAYDAFEDATGELAQKSPVNSSFNVSYSEITDGSSAKYVGFMDWIVPLIYFGIFIIIGILAWLLPNNPIFTVFYVVIALTLVLAGVFISIAMYTALSDGALTDYTDSWPKTMFLLRWLAPVNFFAMLFVGIALFVKPDGGGFN